MLLFNRAGFNIRAAGTEGTFVHFATLSKRCLLWELRRTKRTGKQAVATADAEIFVMQNNTVFGLHETVSWADRHTRRITTMHTSYRDRVLVK